MFEPEIQNNELRKNEIVLQLLEVKKCCGRNINF